MPPSSMQCMRFGPGWRLASETTLTAVITYAQTMQEESGRSFLRNPARRLTTSPFRGRETESVE